MKLLILFVFSVILNFKAITQSANDNCANAESLCESTPTNGNTAAGTNEICINCGDGALASGITCFDFEKTVWYSFNTNATGGVVSANVTNINCVGAGNNLSGIIYSATTPCDASTYAAVSNCEALSSTGFSLNTIALNPNTTYYIQISSGSDCTFDIEVIGPGVTTPNSSVNIISSATGTQCEQTPVTFNAVTNNCSNPMFIWLINGTPVANGNQNYTTTNLKDGDAVTAQVICECSSGSTSNAIVASMFVNTLNAGPDINIPLGSSTELNASGSSTYTWTPANSLNDPNISNPVAFPIENTTYVVSATSVDGCAFTDSVNVNIIDSITVPNTFTPNSDGVNDTWEILNIENFPKVKITVYDRWGQQVYKTIGYPPSKRWNGTKAGKKLPPTTYYYIISLSIDLEEEKLVMGSVTIVY